MGTWAQTPGFQVCTQPHNGPPEKRWVHLSIKRDMLEWTQEAAAGKTIALPKKHAPTVTSPMEHGGLVIDRPHGSEGRKTLAHDVF